MSLVEDARRLEHAAERLANILTGCLGYLPADLHDEALERLAAYEPCADHPGRIVAALEAAEAWVASLETANTNAAEHIHVEQRLIDALCGDEVPA